jgi:hypothetical protein
MLFRFRQAPDVIPIRTMIQTRSGNSVEVAGAVIDRRASNQRLSEIPVPGQISGKPHNASRESRLTEDVPAILSKPSAP